MSLSLRGQGDEAINQKFYIFSKLNITLYKAQYFKSPLWFRQAQPPLMMNISFGLIKFIASNHRCIECLHDAQPDL